MFWGWRCRCLLWCCRRHSPRFWARLLPQVPHHSVNYLPFISCRSAGVGDVVPLVGGFWLNHFEVLHLLYVTPFISWIRLITGPLWCPSGSVLWLQIHIHWPLSSSGTLDVFIQKETGAKISTVYPYIPGICSTHPSIRPASTLSISPTRENTVQCWSVALKPPPFIDNWTNFALHRFLTFLEGAVWLGTIALQPWEGPFCPKIFSNSIGRCKWSISSWSDPAGHVSQRAPSAVGGTL